MGKSAWPLFLSGCVAPGCGRSWPDIQYRAKGLCGTCHNYYKSTGELHKFRKIPEELSDDEYRKVFNDPRGYVRSVLSESHASQFSDDDIKAEALRVWTATVNRWFNVGWRYDPSVQVELHEPPRVEDFVWGAGLSPDGDQPHGMACEQDPKEDAPKIDVHAWEADAARMSRVAGAALPDVALSAAALVLTWRRESSLVQVVVPTADQEPYIRVEDQAWGLQRHRYTHGMLRMMLVNLVDPIDPSEMEDE